MSKLRIIIVCVVIMILSINHKAHSQFRVGVKAAYYLSFNKSSEIKYDDALDFLTYKIKFIEEDVDPVLGVFASYQNDMVYVRADLAYRNIHTRFSYINYLTYGDLKPHDAIKETKSFLIPLEAGLVVENFKFGAGPSIVFHYTQNKIFESIPEFEERRRKIDTGFHLSFSYVINQLQIDLLYEQRFHGVGDYFYYRGDQKSFQQASQYISIGLSYILPIN